MTKRYRYWLPALLLICLGWLSCKQERAVCFEPVNATLRMGAYQGIEVDTGIVVTDSSLPKALIIALDTPKVQIYAPDRASKFGLLLSPHADSTRFIIMADSAQISIPALYDTVTFYYQRRLEFLSVACGYTYFFTLGDRVRTTNNYIDSVQVVNSNVTNAANVEHVKIFF